MTDEIEQKNQSNTREYTLPNNTETLRAGISWDFIDKPVDLDMSVLVFDNVGSQYGMSISYKKLIILIAIFFSIKIIQSKKHPQTKIVIMIFKNRCCIL